MIDDTTDSGGNFTWTGATTTTGDFTFTTGSTDSVIFTVNGTSWYPIIPDKNWMPYRHFEYMPKWHQKFARYKLQMQTMWD